MRKLLLAFFLMLSFVVLLTGCGGSSSNVSKDDLNKLQAFAKTNQLTESEFNTACSTLKDAGVDFSRINQNIDNLIYLGCKDGDFLDRKLVDEWKAKGIKHTENVLVLKIDMGKKDGTNLVKNIHVINGFVAKEGYSYYNFKKNFDVSKLIVSKKEAAQLRELSEKELLKQLEKVAKEAKNVQVVDFLPRAYIDKGIISSDTYGYKTGIKAVYELKTVGGTLKKSIYKEFTFNKDFKLD